MKALPSIAFGGFSGSAKGVTARQVAGRTILSVRCWPTGIATAAQIVRRSSLSKVTKSYKNLTADQQKAWEKLAESASGVSVFGQKAKLSGHNLFVRLNINRAYTGEQEPIMDAPEVISDIPRVEFGDFWFAPSGIVFTNVVLPNDSLKMVIKVSDSQSPGVSSGWGNTVIISPDTIPDWGEIDLTVAFESIMKHTPILGEKYFIEMYWIDPATGFTGISRRESVVCQEGSAGSGEVLVPRTQVKRSNITSISDNYIAEDFNLECVKGSMLAYIYGKFTNTGNYGSISIEADTLNRSIPAEYTFFLSRGDSQYTHFSICSWSLLVSNDYYNNDHIYLGRVSGGFPDEFEVFGVAAY